MVESHDLPNAWSRGGRVLWLALGASYFILPRDSGMLTNSRTRSSNHYVTRGDGRVALHVVHRVTRWRPRKRNSRRYFTPSRHVRWRRYRRSRLEDLKYLAPVSSYAPVPEGPFSRSEDKGQGQVGEENGPDVNADREGRANSGGECKRSAASRTGTLCL